MRAPRFERLSNEELLTTLSEKDADVPAVQLYAEVRRLGHTPENDAHALAVLHVVGRVSKSDLLRRLQTMHVSASRDSFGLTGPTFDERRKLADAAQHHAQEQWTYIQEAIDAFKRSLKRKPIQ